MSDDRAAVAAIGVWMRWAATLGMGVLLTACSLNPVGGRPPSVAVAAAAQPVQRGVVLSAQPVLVQIDREGRARVAEGPITDRRLPLTEAVEHIVRLDDGRDVAVVQSDVQPSGQRVLVINDGVTAHLQPEPVSAGTMGVQVEPMAPPAPPPAAAMTATAALPAPSPAAPSPAAPPPPAPTERMTESVGAFRPSQRPIAPAPAMAAPPAASNDTPAATPAAVGDSKAHLASYHTQAEATAAWGTLAGRQPNLSGLHPSVAAVDLGARGRMWRLYAVGPAEKIAQLCADWKQRGLYCEVM